MEPRGTGQDLGELCPLGVQILAEFQTPIFECKEKIPHMSRRKVHNLGHF